MIGIGICESDYHTPSPDNLFALEGAKPAGALAPHVAFANR